MAEDERDPIPAEQAREILYAAIRERLGEDWDDEFDGWTVVTGHDYMARLTNGKQTMDFYVDLLGEVTVKEQEALPGIETGRMTAWLWLGGSLFAALVIARLAGFL